MSKNAMEKLSALEIKKAKPKDKTYKLADGGGLYLQISPDGGMYWRYQYRFLGKQKSLALGVYPEIPLKAARKAHKDARLKLADNIDPSEARRQEKLARTEAQANSFEAVAQEWLVRQQVAPETDKKNRWLMETFAFPYIGHRPIADISPRELLDVLRRVESTGKLETAQRLKTKCGQVFRHAIIEGKAEIDPTASLRGALKSPKVKHRAAITDPSRLGKLLRDMQASTAGPVVKTALLLTPILFQRPGEIRQMEWSEINWEEQRWEIPADKMKMRHPHIVPLPQQAMALLQDIHLFTGRGKYVFPSQRGASRCLSENGVRVALRDMGYGNDDVTPHGFRATARTILDEVLGYRIEWIEHQLAHAVKDPNGTAYNRTSFLSQRTKMMQEWANYLDALRDGKQFERAGTTPETQYSLSCESTEKENGNLKKDGKKSFTALFSNYASQEKPTSD